MLNNYMITTILAILSQYTPLIHFVIDFVLVAYLGVLYDRLQKSEVKRRLMATIIRSEYKDGQNDQ